MSLYARFSQLWNWAPSGEQTQLGQEEPIHRMQIVESKCPLNFLWTSALCACNAVTGRVEEANPLFRSRACSPSLSLPFHFVSLCSSIPSHGHQEGQNIAKQHLTILAGARKTQWYHPGLRGQVLWEGGGSLRFTQPAYSTLLAFKLGLHPSLWPC